MKKAARKRKAQKVMHEFKHGQLRSGSKKGPRVTDRSQAIAIMMSQTGQSKKKGKKRKRTNISEALSH